LTYSFSPQIISIFYQDIFHAFSRPTVCVTGGWGEQGLETENRHSSEKSQKNAQGPSRPMLACKRNLQGLQSGTFLDTL
jgi:hypothetical protein